MAKNTKTAEISPETTSPEDNSSNPASARATKWNQAHPERRREIQRQYRVKNAAKIKVSRELAKEKCLAATRKWKQKNATRVYEQNKAWQQANKDKTAAYSHSYYEKHKPEHALRTKKWRQDHPIEALLLTHKRRAKVIGNRIVKEQISNWFNRECGVCEKLIEGKFHIDHTIPLSRGGTHVVTNLQLTHPSCNVRKHNKLPSELMGALI